MEQLSEQTYAMYAYHEFFFIFFLYYRPDNIFSRVHRKNLYLQIVVNSLITRLIRPDLPKSFHRNVHIYTDFLSV